MNTRLRISIGYLHARYFSSAVVEALTEGFAPLRRAVEEMDDDGVTVVAAIGGHARPTFSGWSQSSFNAFLIVDTGKRSAKYFRRSNVLSRHLSCSSQFTEHIYPALAPHTSISAAFVSLRCAYTATQKLRTLTIIISFEKIKYDICLYIWVVSTVQCALVRYRAQVKQS